jgi:uncharacterized protein with HEPN domain
LQAIEEIEAFTGDKTLADYKANRMMKLAVERAYEIIGEALKRMNDEFPLAFGQITDGRKIIDFRNILAHGYDAVADEIVWSVTQNNLKQLKTEVEDLLNHEHQ